MPFRPTEHLKGKFYWPVDHYSIPADNLCYHFEEEFFDCPCVKMMGHSGAHEYRFSPRIEAHSHKAKATSST